MKLSMMKLELDALRKIVDAPHGKECEACIARETTCDPSVNNRKPCSFYIRGAIRQQNRNIKGVDAK